MFKGHLLTVQSRHLLISKKTHSLQNRWGNILSEVVLPIKKLCPSTVLETNATLTFHEIIVFDEYKKLLAEKATSSHCEVNIYVMLQCCTRYIKTVSH